MQRNIEGMLIPSAAGVQSVNFLGDQEGRGTITSIDCGVRAVSGEKNVRSIIVLLQVTKEAAVKHFSDLNFLF